jgi:hypothetical protein
VRYTAAGPAASIVASVPAAPVGSPVAVAIDATAQGVAILPVSDAGKLFCLGTLLVGLAAAVRKAT